MVKKTRNIGIDVKAPEKPCENDRHCPFHGTISLRGRVFKGKVVRARVPKNALVEWNWLKLMPKYERYEKKRTRVIVHNPTCIAAKEGDIVRIMETKKISKSKNFVIIEKLGHVDEISTDIGLGEESRNAELQEKAGKENKENKEIDDSKEKVNNKNQDNKIKDNKNNKKQSTKKDTKGE